MKSFNPNHSEFQNSEMGKSFIGVLLLSLPYLWISRLGAVEAQVPVLLTCLSFAFTAYWFFCVEGKLKFSSLQILLLGLFLRVILIPLPPCDDMYRYIWEGKVLNFGFSPFKLSPDSPVLSGLRDENWNLINHPNLPTLYPIVTEALFAFLFKISGSIWFFKIAFIAFDVGAFLILRRMLRTHGNSLQNQSTKIEAIYFLNPLLILEIAGRGHFDSLAIFFNMAFIWGLQSGHKTGAISLGLGALSKINSLALTPLLFLQMHWKRALTWSMGIGLVVVAATIKTGMLDTLGQFTTQFHYNSMMPFLIEKILPSMTRQGHQVIGIIIMIASAAFLFFKLKQVPIERQALAFMGLLLCFSPTLHPWYLLWILPFAALTQSKPWLLLSGTIMLTYLVYGRAYSTGHWQEISWLRYPEFIPPLVFWLILTLKSKFKKVQPA